MGFFVMIGRRTVTITKNCKKNRKNYIVNLKHIKNCNTIKPGCLDSLDQLLKTVKIVHRVETNIFYFSVEIFKIETFQSRLTCVEIFVETVEIETLNRDCVKTN
jgi:hypothetical protein